MENWFNQVVKLLTPQFAANGGPIVLVQVENELSARGPNGSQYINWCGEMAEKALSAVPVPIIMCNGDSAPNTINSCNGNECTGFIEKNGQSGKILISQPALWTEDEGGFQVWGESPSKIISYFWGRNTSDVAYTALQWVARGGSHFNYYMYYGGNNFGRTAGSGITTMYASDVPICPDTFPHEPKFSHLGLLHSVIKTYGNIIASTPAQLGHSESLQWFDNTTGKWENGTQQLAWMYKSAQGSVIFIENQNKDYVLTRYNNNQYDMPGLSISVVDGTTLKVVFNSATIKPPTYRRVDQPFPTNTPFAWKIWKEPLDPADTAKFPSTIANNPIEQTAITIDKTQYLWYETTVSLSSAQSVGITIATQSSDVLLVFVDGVLKGTADDHTHSGFAITQKISLGQLSAGNHVLQILSENIGYDNGMGSGSTQKTKGITGKVLLGTQDITNLRWINRPSLAGEVLQVFTDAGSKNITWSSDLSKAGPVTWYRAEITISRALAANEGLLLDANGLGRGHAYFNGLDLGRYWTILMNDGSGNPTQRYYHIPSDLVVVGTNVLTLSEIEGASDSSKSRLILRSWVPVSADRINLQDIEVSCPL